MLGKKRKKEGKKLHARFTFQTYPIIWNWNKRKQTFSRQQLVSKMTSWKLLHFHLRTYVHESERHYFVRARIVRYRCLLWQSYYVCFKLLLQCLHNRASTMIQSGWKEGGIFMRLCVYYSYNYFCTYVPYRIVFTNMLKEQKIDQLNQKKAA